MLGSWRGAAVPDLEETMDQLPPPLLEPQPAEAQPPAMSLAARLFNVFAIPGDVFDDVKRSMPSVGNWLVPTLLLVLAGLVGANLIFSQPAIQQQMRESQEQMIQKMVDKGMIPKDRAEQQLEASGTGGKIAPYAGAVLVPVISLFWWGMVIWLVGAKLFKSDFGFMKGVEAAGLASAIWILESIITTLLSVSLGSLNGSPSAALLVKNYDPQNTSHALLTVLNVTTVWLLAVRAVALARLGGVRFARAAVWVFGVWAAYTGFFIGLGLVVKAIFGL